jgi:hypothetical protein
MKRIGILLLIAVSAMARQAAFDNSNLPLLPGGPRRPFNPNLPLFPDDPKGLKLPPGEPRAVDAHGNVIWIDQQYTTEKYRDAALNLVIAEANKIAKELNLDEQLPICKTNIVEAWVGPFGNNYFNQRVGNISTKNYAYYMSVGNSFSYLENMRLDQECRRYRMQYTWPVSRMDTNQAYQLATQWLNAVSMDVKGLNRDCRLVVEPYEYSRVSKGEFVPIYEVGWIRSDLWFGDTASVIVATPEKELLSLRVEDPRYILRKPIVFTNLDALLPGPTQIFSATNPPAPAWPGK